MKLIAYLRVSGISQVNDGFGLDTQHDGIEAWANANGHQITRFVKDAGVSGTVEPMERPGFVDVVDHLYNRGEAEGIITFDLTRLARGLIEQEHALEALWAAGATVFTVTQGLIDAEDEDGTRTLMRHIMGAVAQYQRTNLLLKAKLGKDKARHAGQHTDGVAPYGWCIEDKRLVVNPSQQNVLRHVDTYRQAGMTWYKIARELNAQGIRTGTGAKWSDASIRKVMHNSLNYNDKP